jgi:hypothetical protein
MTTTDPRAFDGLKPLEVGTGFGIVEAPSRIDAPMGSLSQVRNFEVVNGAYEESQGLTIVGPTIDQGLKDFWHADIDRSRYVYRGTFQTGDYLYWYAEDGETVAGSARMYYASVDGTEAKITIDQVTGASPRRAQEFYTSNGATLTLLANDADVFKRAIDLDISHQDFLGAAFLGSLTTEQAVSSTTWNAFKPDPLGVQGISGVFQLNDNIYAVRDFFGGKFKEGANKPETGDLITVGSFTARVARVVLTGGTWEEGDAEGVIHLYPDILTSTDMSLTDSDWTNENTITNSDQGVTVGKTVSSGVRNYKNKGLLWKKDKDRLQGGWSLVDLGSSVRFNNGQTAPKAVQAPLLTTDALDSVTDTGDLDTEIPATDYPSTGTYSAWTGLSNMVAAAAGSYTSSTIASEDYSRVLKMELSRNTVPGDAKILGIEVTVTCHQGTDSDIRFHKVQLVNDSSDREEYFSENRSTNAIINDTPGTEYTFGSQLDKWGYEDLTQDDINSSEMYLLLQFYNTDLTTSQTVNIDQVSVKVHYALVKQRVYFWDGTSADVAIGDLYAYQVHDGDWSTDDAQGWMTVYNLDGGSTIPTGCEIRSASGGNGELIGTVMAVSKNLLPSMEEMDARNAIYQTRLGTFSGDEDAEAIYVATGAGPAFSLDREDRFAFIRLPIDESKDKPRYVETHRNHLLLATGSHILISSVGAPNNFSTYDGATTWSLKDRITGLANAPNGTTMITCEDSIHILSGGAASGEDSFNIRMYTDNNGARDYTITNLLGNMFVDWAGLTTADISDKYGGFDIGRKSSHARPTMQELLGQQPLDSTAAPRVIGAMPVRRKNQYRVYFSDGAIITATMPDTQDQPIAFTMQHYMAYYQGDTRGYDSTFAPTALSSAVMTNGEESLLIGTRLGHVMRVDPDFMQVLSYSNKATALPERADNLKVIQPFKFIDFNALHGRDPSQQMHWKRADVYVEHGGFTDINRVFATDYNTLDKIPAISAAVDNVGDYTRVGDSSSYRDKAEDDYFTWYIDEVSDGLVIRLSKFGGRSSIPLRISKMFMRVEMKGVGQNPLHEDRAYEVLDGVLPQDLNVVGETINLTLSMGTPSITKTRAVTGDTITASIAMGTPSISLTTLPWTFDTTDFTWDSTAITWDGSS